MSRHFNAHRIALIVLSLGLIQQVNAGASSITVVSNVIEWSFKSSDKGKWCHPTAGCPYHSRTVTVWCPSGTERVSGGAAALWRWDEDLPEPWVLLKGSMPTTSFSYFPANRKQGWQAQYTLGKQGREMLIPSDGLRIVAHAVCMSPSN